MSLPFIPRFRCSVLLLSLFHADIVHARVNKAIEKKRGNDKWNGNAEMADEETSSENTRENGLMKKKNLFSRTWTDRESECRGVPEKSVLFVPSTFDSHRSSAKDSFNFLHFKRNYPTCNTALRPQIEE